MWTMRRRISRSMGGRRTCKGKGALHLVGVAAVLQEMAWYGQVGLYDMRLGYLR